VIGDYAAGSMYLALGILTGIGILQAHTSGQGQVVDVSIVDSAASLMTVVAPLREAGLMNGERGTSLLDLGAPIYDVYECADGKHVSVGSVEQQFYLQLLQLDAHKLGQ
jgi:crotonobetainyl-CoA:carnitine CoA-transferase CaiB-like acyl-CoA transferase